MWRGWASPARAGEYDRHYRSEVLSMLRDVPGFLGARLLRRDVDEQTEFLSVTYFADLDAVRAFAGQNYETAVVADEARRVLTRFDNHVTHYDVAFEALPPNA
jgi:heme-degrading monooxygenase HmoA